jgi:C1A family cysteine protease
LIGEKVDFLKIFQRIFILLYSFQVEGVVRPVQNQGSCGSCWAFAGVAALEGQISVLANRHDKISEQEIIDCVRSWSGELLGCNGGRAMNVYYHAHTAYGVTYGFLNPYKGYPSTCNTNRSRVMFSKTDEIPQGGLPYRSDEKLIQELLINQGPLYASFCEGIDF